MIPDAAAARSDAATAAGDAPPIDILLVDDQPDGLLALEAMLEGPGRNLVKAASGDDALRALLHRDFAVILMDVRMPGMDGYELAELIRGRERSRSTPIIFLTAADDDEGQASRGYAAGAVDYVFKPIAPEVLRSKVAVFVELQRRSDLIRRQADDLRRSEREARELAEARSALVDDLARRNRELEEAHRKLQEVDDLKTRFFANVSHELRTPLALVLGPVEQLLATPDARPDVVAQSLGVVRRNAMILLKHVNELLDLAKVEAGEMSARYSRTDLLELVRVVASHFQELARSRRVDYRVTGDAAIPCEIDQEKVAGALFNVLSNAFRFAPVGGQVSCAARFRNERATITVEDDGPGIPEESLEEIFERFRRPAGAPRFTGSGLGLTIARELLQVCGATISARNLPCGGAGFSIELPLRAPPGEALDESSGIDDAAIREQARFVEEPPAPEQLHEPRPGRATILVVEDNVEMRRFLASILEGAYRVLVARDGAEGLERALREPPDLVVTDVMMPALDGVGLVARLREHPETAEVPVIVLTARAEPALVTRMLREGAQDYVVKPFSEAELRARVDNLVSMGRARQILRGALESSRGDVETLAAELARKSREIEQAYQQVDVARKYAERSSKIRSNFLNMLSHEVRTPVSVLQLQMEVLKESMAQTLGERQHAVLDRVAGAARRLMDLVEAVLEYSRVESGRLEVNAVPIDVAALAVETVDDLKPHAARKGLSLDLSCNPDMPTLVADPRLVRLLLANLVTNALKFTERGSVHVDVDYEPAEHLLRVTDSGPGIPREEQATIFEPFEQLGPVRHKHHAGVGLGLSLVRELTTALGWRIHLDSEPGRGSTFTLSVPSGTIPPPGRPEPPQHALESH